MNTMRWMLLYALLLAAGVLVGSVEVALRADETDGSGDETTTDDACLGDRNGTTFCRNCTLVLDCTSADGALQERPCASDTACMESDDGAKCVPEQEAVECSCTGDSQCDPFDNNIVMVCNPGGGVLLTLECGDGQLCYDGQCGATTTPAPTTTTPAPLPVCDVKDAGTWKPITPGCTSYGFCMSDQTTAIKNDCEAGSYYDEIIGECTPTPPKPCTKCEGTCSDPNDCSRYYECKGGQIVSYYQCLDDAKPIFNLFSGSCVSEIEACDPRVACGYGLESTTPIGKATTTPVSDVTTTQVSVVTTTPVGDVATTPIGGTTAIGSETTTQIGGDGTTPSASVCNEDNEYQMYPYPGNCKMFCQCKATASGAYTVVCAECPGLLVYNEDAEFCDLHSNVPDCVIPTTSS